MKFKCALCGRNASQNVYYCSEHNWHICWNCAKKSALTNRVSCPKCGNEISRVD